MAFREHFDDLPLIAILRGVRPDEAVAIGEVLVAAGFRLIEVPLNSPDPFASIAGLAAALAGRAAVGAGTVMTSDDIDNLCSAGGEFVVMPHSDPVVIGAAKKRKLTCLPGVATPNEAFTALAAGADGLKLFPAETLPPVAVKAWRAVLPAKTPLLPVGGISPDKMASYLVAGATGFGLGSALYRPGDAPAEVAVNARDFVAAWTAALGS
jgi:2-dehydro-3-deoxyphosphogalactonate aldolase